MRAACSGWLARGNILARPWPVRGRTRKRPPQEMTRQQKSQPLAKVIHMVEADSQPTLGAADEEAPPTRADEEPGSVVALQDELIHQLDAVDEEAPPPPDAAERGSVVALQDELIHQLDAVDAPLDSSAISLSSRSVGASPDSRSSWRDIGLETPEEKAKGRGWGFVRRCTLSSSAGSSTGPATGLSSSAGSVAAGATTSSSSPIAGPAV